MRAPDVAIIGRMGSGKTTAAEVLSRQLGYHSIHFAGLLKEIAATLWGPSAQTDRRKLQELGVAVRLIEPDTWVDALMRREVDRPQRDYPVVVDDCRFENEYWALAGRGFRFLRVEAAEDVRVNRLLAIRKLEDKAQLLHESETGLDDIDIRADTIRNEWDINEFQEDIFEWWNRECRRVA